MQHDTDALKAALPVAEYCATKGIKLHKSGAELRGACPLCQVTRQSKTWCLTYLWMERLWWEPSEVGKSQELVSTMSLEVRVVCYLKYS